MASDEPTDLTTRILVDIRDEIRELRSEQKQQGVELRGEIGALRTEMHEQIGGLRSEMHEEIGGLRSEMHEEIGGLRSEMGEVRAEMSGMGVTLKQVLVAVQYGNDQRDERVTDHEIRIRKLEERTGIA